MSSPFSVNIGGDFGPAAKALVEKTAEFIEGRRKPEDIVRIAEARAKAIRIEAAAKADADLVDATAQLQIQEMTARQQRAIQRMLWEEDSKQASMEAIRDKSVPLIEDSAKPEQIERDWMANFFDKCKIISDEQMQTLWAKILAGEANAPGSFSKRTVNFLATLDKRDAELFQSFYRFVWNCGGIPVPLIYDIRKDIYSKEGIAFHLLHHLASIGLIHYEGLGAHSLNIGEGMVLAYFEKHVLCQPTEGRAKLSIGHVLLTETGAELGRLCEVKPVEGFFAYILNELQRQKANLSSMLSIRDQLLRQAGPDVIERGKTVFTS